MKRSKLPAPISLPVIAVLLVLGYNSIAHRMPWNQTSWSLDEGMDPSVGHFSRNTNLDEADGVTTLPQRGKVDTVTRRP